MTSRLRKKNFIKVFILVTIIVALVFAASSYILSKKDANNIIATVNGKKIYKSEVKQKLQSVLDGQFFGKQQDIQIPEIATLPKEVINILAKEVYLERNLVAKAKKSPLVNSKEIRKKVKEAKNKILRQAYVDAIIAQEVNDKTISNKYAELSNELVGKKEYLLFHIVTKDQATMKKAQRELKRLRNFSKVAKRFSIDPDSSKKGGELGYIIEDNIMKEIAKILPKLKKGQISQPIKTKFGWHLIKYTKVRDAEALPFETVKNNIREQLYQDTINNINLEITKNAQVEILIPLQDLAKPQEITEEKEQKINNEEK